MGDRYRTSACDEQPFKRFMVFGYGQYYPGGGMNDFMASFDTLDEALAYKRREDGQRYDYDILDRVEGVIVETD